MPCLTCKHWSAIDGLETGLCRGMPPTAVQGTGFVESYRFPTTPKDEHCGLFVKRLAPKKLIHPVTKRISSETDADLVAATIDAIWHEYPERETPHLFIPARKAINTLLDAGIVADVLVQAATGYATHCRKDGTAKKYVKSLHLFFADDFWTAYADQTVEGLTKTQWIRNGLDVTQFDAMLDGMARDKDPVGDDELPF